LIDFPGVGEGFYEFFYRSQISPWFWIKPDLQYVVNPGGVDENDALALGVRNGAEFLITINRSRMLLAQIVEGKHLSALAFTGTHMENHAVH